MNTRLYPDKLHLSIAGEWIGTEGRKILAVINPSTGQPLADLPVATVADLDRALDAAETAWGDWKARTVEERGVLIRKAADLLDGRVEAIAHILSLEQGKPLAEARGDVVAGIRLLRLHVEEAKRAYGKALVRPAGKRATVSYEPVGPAAGFAPWNFPFFNVARKIGPALAAGCPIITKPAEETPGSAIMLQRALIEAGIPGGVSQMVFGDPGVISSHLIASPVIRKISFTGSVPVGKSLMKLAADGMKRTTMELGGHAPVIVFDDADLDKALDALVPATFRNAGQVCVSPTRFLVQEGIYDRFAREFARRTEALKVGDALADGVQMGPLANTRRTGAIERMVMQAIDAGARSLTGAERIDGSGSFYRPTVLKDVPLDVGIMREEPFGPVAVMRPFAQMDDAVEIANSLPYGLAAYLFTEGLDRALRCADAIESGMVAVNSTVLSTGDAPFGGIKESGHGMEDGAEGCTPIWFQRSFTLVEGTRAGNCGAGLIGCALVCGFPAAAWGQDDRVSLSVDYSELRVSNETGSYFLEMVLAADMGGPALELKTVADIPLDGAATSGEAEVKFVQPISGSLSFVAGGLRTFDPVDDVTVGFVGAQIPLMQRVESETLLLISEFGEVEVTSELSARFDVGRSVAILPKTKIIFSEAGDTARFGGPHGWEAALRVGYGGRGGVLPYVGFIHWRALGDAAREMRIAGENTRSTSGVVGFRAGF